LIACFWCAVFCLVAVAFQSFSQHPLLTERYEAHFWETRAEGLLHGDTTGNELTTGIGARSNRRILFESFRFCLVSWNSRVFIVLCIRVGGIFGAGNTGGGIGGGSSLFGNSSSSTATGFGGGIGGGSLGGGLGGGSTGIGGLGGGLNNSGLGGARWFSLPFRRFTRRFIVGACATCDFEWQYRGECTERRMKNRTCERAINGRDKFSRKKWPSSEHGLKGQT